MKVFKFLCVKAVLVILVLGFSTSCGKDDNTDDKTTDVAPIVTDDTLNDVLNNNIDDNHIADDVVTDDDFADDVVINIDGDVLDSEIATDSSDNNRNVWSDLPYGVRAYVRKQTCSGGEVINSDLVVDFRDVELAPNVTMANWSSLPHIYCNDETTSCGGFKIERSAPSAYQERMHSNTLGLVAPVLFFDRLRSNDYGVTFIPKFKQRDPLDGNKVKEILFVEGNVDVNFPNTKTCGEDVGDVRCNVENECVNAPESHICVFDYGKCSSGSSTYLHTISCNEGYVETTDDTIGVFFGAEAKSPRLAKRCVKEE